MDSPSARIVAAAFAPIVATDAQGRQLTLHRLGALDKLRLFKAVGPHLASNPPYIGMAALAMAVTAIDAVPVPQPTTESQIEALVAKLGDAGIEAIARALHTEAAPAGGDHAGN